MKILHEPHKCRVRVILGKTLRVYRHTNDRTLQNTTLVSTLEGIWPLCRQTSVESFSQCSSLCDTIFTWAYSELRRVSIIMLTAVHLLSYNSVIRELTKGGGFQGGGGGRDHGWYTHLLSRQYPSYTAPSGHVYVPKPLNLFSTNEPRYVAFDPKDISPVSACMPYLDSVLQKGVATCVISKRDLSVQHALGTKHKTLGCLIGLLSEKQKKHEQSSSLLTRGFSRRVDAIYFSLAVQEC